MNVIMRSHQNLYRLLSNYGSSVPLKTGTSQDISSVIGMKGDVCGITDFLYAQHLTRRKSRGIAEWGMMHPVLPGGRKERERAYMSPAIAAAELSYSRK